ncbi:MAG: prepilin-type N-terminal cleavage/methylation domain-containing protein [Armatimonadetes bacterium]|nr:prepilin-type N-terminal cleavage/methylation domain-containing protein [Armatimonadota bacterium]
MEKNSKGFTLIELMIVIAIIAILAAILVPNFIRARAQGQVTACKSNLKNISTALEMYSTDSKGRYPTTLGTLVSNYLRAVPTCPSAGSDTYTAGYTSVQSPDGFTVWCTGTYHSGVGSGANMPQYSAVGGLIE